MNMNEKPQLRNPTLKEAGIICIHCIKQSLSVEVEVERIPEFRHEKNKVLIDLCFMCCVGCQCLPCKAYLARDEKLALRPAFVGTHENNGKGRKGTGWIDWN